MLLSRPPWPKWLSRKAIILKIKQSGLRSNTPKEVLLIAELAEIMKAPSRCCFLYYGSIEHPHNPQKTTWSKSTVWAPCLGCWQCSRVGEKLLHCIAVSTFSLVNFLDFASNPFCREEMHSFLEKRGPEMTRWWNLKTCKAACRGPWFRCHAKALDVATLQVSTWMQPRVSISSSSLLQFWRYVFL